MRIENESVPAYSDHTMAVRPQVRGRETRETRETRESQKGMQAETRGKLSLLAWVERYNMIRIIRHLTA